LIITAHASRLGLWVTALVAAGYAVYGINPLQAAPYRERHSVSGAKSDLLTELIRVLAGHRPIGGRCQKAGECPAPRLAGRRGIGVELAASESGHAASYHLLPFSSLPFGRCQDPA
jgi:hypothetical protein